MTTISTLVFAPDDKPGPWWYGVVNDTDVHIVPVCDLHPHDDGDCSCSPVIELNAADEAFRAVVIHNSFDRRELTEPQ